MTTAATDVLRRKLDRCFAVLDVNGDGILKEEDYIASGKRLAQSFGLADGTEQAQTLQREYVKMWTDIQSTGATAEGLTPDGFAESITQAQQTDIAAYMQHLDGLTDAFVAICDTDHDGKISQDEYSRMFTAAFDMSNSDAAVSFQHLDIDADGVLSRVEIRSASEEFFTSKDPNAKGNWLFGPWQ